jgi:hypothetical protein
LTRAFALLAGLIFAYGCQGAVYFYRPDVVVVPPPAGDPPAPWTEEQIDGGSLTFTCDLTYDAGEWTFETEGGQFFGTADDGCVAATAVEGDWTLTLRITDSDIDGDPVSAKPFLGARQSLDGDASNIHCGVRGATGRRCYERANVGGSTTTYYTDATTTTFPKCFKFEVDADNQSARGYQSSNCSDYDSMDERELSWLGSAHYVVFGATPNDSGDLGLTLDAVFDTVSLDTSTPVNHGTPTEPESETPDYEDPVEGVTHIGGRTASGAANISAWQTAGTTVPCGRTVTLGATSFSGNVTWDRDCPADNPAILQGASNFTSVYTSGTLDITGANNIVRGVFFSGGKIKLRGTNNKVLANKITNWADVAIQIGNNNDPTPGTQGEIAYNECYSPAPYSGSAVQFRMCIRLNTSSDPNTVHTDFWVHHNHFHDFPDHPIPNDFGSGQADTREYGESNYGFSSTLLAGGYDEYNLAEDLLQDGEAAVDVKLGGVVVRRNTFRDGVDVRVDARVGTNVKIEENWFEEGGTTVHSANNRVVCNVYDGDVDVATVGEGIVVMSGNIDWNGAGTQHQRAQDTLIAKNTGKLKVGDRPNPSSSSYASYIFPSLRTTIEQHTGDETYDFHSETVDNSGSASDAVCTIATEMNVSQVGPSAITSASAGYKAARGF